MALSFGGQLEFARAFAEYSGMNGDIVLAWCLQEQPPGKPAYPGSNNWLNIESPGGIGGYEEKRIGNLGPFAAAYASVQWMKRYQSAIYRSKGHSAERQIAAIVNSGWAESKYGGIAKFTAVYHEVLGAKLPPTRSLTSGVTGSVNAAGTGNPPDHAAKTRASGRLLSVHGQHLSGTAAQMRSLRSKLITPHLNTRRRNIRA